jgi:hypothetical protein
LGRDVRPWRRSRRSWRWRWSPPGQAPTAVEILKEFCEKPGQLALCMCTIGCEPKAVSWLEQLTRATAARHGQIAIFSDNGSSIQYARDGRRQPRGKHNTPLSVARRVLSQPRIPRVTRHTSGLQ